MTATVEQPQVNATRTAPRRPTSGRLAGRIGLQALVIAGVLVALTAIGWLVPTYSVFALAAACVVLLIGLTAHEPAAIPLAAMPAMVVVQRIGGESVNLTFSDFALFIAFWCALFFTRRPFSRPMRTLLWLSAAYQAATLFTVLVNPYRQNTVEWFHAWLSVGGALVVGWAVGRAGRARTGLTLFLLACIGIAVLTCIDAGQQLAAGESGPVYLEWPFLMHKNFIGCVLAFAALVAYARPDWLGWPRSLALTTFWLCTIAIVGSQARQALVGLSIGVLIVAMRPSPGRRRSKVILLAVVPALYFVGAAIQDQLASNNEFNSAHQRLTWYQQALEIWRENPTVGVGLRWWTAGRTEYTFQPPNAELEVLSSAGLVGLIGFIALMGGALVVLWRVDRRFGTLAFAVLATRLVQSQFDLFWSAIVVSVPFVLIGICLGAQAYSAERDTADGEGDEGGGGRTGPTDRTDPDVRAERDAQEAVAGDYHRVRDPSDGPYRPSSVEPVTAPADATAGRAPEPIASTTSGSGARLVGHSAPSGGGLR